MVNEVTRAALVATSLLPRVLHHIGASVHAEDAFGRLVGERCGCDFLVAMLVERVGCDSCVCESCRGCSCDIVVEHTVIVHRYDFERRGVWKQGLMSAAG